MTALREYLRLVADLRKRNTFGHLTSVYTGLEDFLLRAGESFSAIAAKRGGVRLMTPKQCFHNCGALVQRRADLTYCEGYAMKELIPIHHAWCIDSDGRVIEPTLRKPAVEYIGVRFPTSYVADTQTSENGSMILQWQNKFPIFTIPWDEQPFRKAARP